MFDARFPTFGSALQPSWAGTHLPEPGIRFSLRQGEGGSLFRLLRERPWHGAEHACGHDGCRARDRDRSRKHRQVAGSTEAEPSSAGAGCSARGPRSDPLTGDAGRPGRLTFQGQERSEEGSAARPSLGRNSKKRVKEVEAVLKALGAAALVGLSMMHAQAQEKTIEMGTLSWENLTPITGITKKVSGIPARRQCYGVLGVGRRLRGARQGRRPDPRVATELRSRRTTGTRTRATGKDHPHVARTFSRGSHVPPPSQ